MARFSTEDLYDCQHDGKNFLLQLAPEFPKPAKILADPPGSGKTAMVCAAAAEYGAESGIVLCPAPTIIKDAWATHLVDWGVVDDPSKISLSSIHSKTKIPDPRDTSCLSYRATNSAQAKWQTGLNGNVRLGCFGHGAGAR